MTEESRPTGEAEYEDREDDFEDERDYEYDEAMPLLLLWEQEQSRVHPGFWEALDTLVEAGCQRYHVVYLLHRLPEADFVEKASKDDITTTLADLSRAIEALQRLRAKQLLPLLGPLTRQHWSVLRWLEQTSDEVRKLEITAHGGKSLLVEQLKAALVSHVMDATGDPYDEPVSVLLEAALGPSLWTFDEVGQFTRNENRHFDTYGKEAHSKWRGRHADLIKEGSALRQELFREADVAEGKRVAEWVQRNPPSRARRLEALKLKADGARWEEIAERFGKPVAALKKWLAIDGKPTDTSRKP